MSYREHQIKHENGNFWVLENKKGTFTVYRAGVTHSDPLATFAERPETEDQTAMSAEDALSLAVTYCNYQAKRAKERTAEEASASALRARFKAKRASIPRSK